MAMAIGTPWDKTVTIGAEMIQRQFFRVAALVSVCGLVALSGCGGGDDAEAGGPVDLNVVPTEVKLSAPVGTPADTCLPGDSATIVYINGGAAPYTVQSTDASVAVSKSVVNEKGGSFTVAVLDPVCLTNIQILIKDKLNKQVNVTVSNEPFKAGS